MALDSLLASLKSEVSEVAKVQVNNGGACGRYPTKPGEVSGVSTPGPASAPDTCDTLSDPPRVSRKPLQLLGCPLDTLDTLDTPENGNAAGKPESRCHWLMSLSEIAKVKAWLSFIGEDDQETIAEVVEACQADPEAGDYFIERSAELPARAPTRAQEVPRLVTCSACQHWRPNPINPAGGLGSCSVTAPASRRLVLCGQLERLSARITRGGESYA